MLLTVSMSKKRHRVQIAFISKYCNLSFTVQYFSKPPMQGLFPGYDNVVDPKSLSSFHPTESYFDLAPGGRNWIGGGGERYEAASSSFSRISFPSYFFTAHKKVPQVPSIAPAFFPSHISSLFFSTLPSLLFVKIEATERTRMVPG